MKTILLLLATVLTSQICISQTKPTEKELLGSWKVIAFEDDNGKVYGDVIKDSLYISDDVRKSWATQRDTVLVLAAMEFMMETMRETEMIFAEKGVYIEKRKSKTKEGSYNYDPFTAVLTTNIVGEKAMDASIINGLLQLKMETNKGKILVMHLKKQ